MSFEFPTLNVDRAVLNHVVQRVLQRDDLELLEWDVHPLYGGLGLAVGAALLYRISGVAQTGDGALPWSLVLKILRSPTGELSSLNHPDQRHPTYWKREYFVYSSELLDQLPHGLAAPRCYAIDDLGDSVWLWLEELFDEFGPTWPLSRYGTAARHIARLSGGHLSREFLITKPWLSNGLLRVRGNDAAFFWSNYDRWRDHPRFQVVWPGDLGRRIYHVWQSRDLILNALDRLPHVLCHTDYDRRNIFARRSMTGDSETVVVDWAFLGRGAIGEELAALVGTSVAWNMGPTSRDLPELSEVCFQGFLLGLRDSGWEGDERLVRQGYTAAIALRFGIFSGFVHTITPIEESMRIKVEQAFGASVDELLQRFASMQPFVLSMADEALKTYATGSSRAGI